MNSTVRKLNQQYRHFRYEVLTTVTVTITFSWNVTSFSLVYVYWTRDILPPLHTLTRRPFNRAPVSFLLFLFGLFSSRLPARLFVPLYPYHTSHARLPLLQGALTKIRTFTRLHGLTSQKMFTFRTNTNLLKHEIHLNTSIIKDKKVKLFLCLIN
jgi:hypothetical protein